MTSSRTRVCCSLAILAWNRALLASAFAPTNTLGHALRSSSSLVAVGHHRSYSSSFSALSMSEQLEVQVGTNLDEVRKTIADACEAAGRPVESVRLVAVSKTKPLELVQQAYESGQRVFGENYAQELVEKAGALGHDDVRWHFIGGLQSNKANMLVKGVVPHCEKLVVETVASLKVAKKLENAMTDFEGKTIDIFVQINTSGEESKSGVTVDEAAELCKQIVNECSSEKIQLKGLMTIGAPGDNECLDALVACRDSVAASLGKEPEELEVSMGMSGDYEIAIQKGSTNVRVGSTIFGARDYSNKK